MKKLHAGGKPLPAARVAPSVLFAVRAPSLHARLTTRDEEALRDLVEILTPWLLGIAQALLVDSDEAEEVVQETFTIVWTRIGQVPSDPRGFLAWVLRVARNRAIDRLRARKRRLRKSAHLAENSIEAEQVAEPEEPNEAGTPGWHVHHTVHAALDALPQDQQEVVWLAYFQGLTQSAIAARLGIPMGTVKTRLRLAVEKLRIGLASMKDWVV
jgi:RNA polymerase sigma-70 factor (ECF subfamily)